MLKLGGNTLKYKIDDAVHEMQLEGEHILIHKESEALYSLDDVGQIVWTFLKSGRNLKEIVEQVCVAFNNTVSQSEVAPDIDELINLLLTAGIISTVSE